MVFRNTDISDIPYGAFVEVPFFVERYGHCREYNDIILEIVATCELPASSYGASKYQYDAIYSDDTHEVEILYDEILPPSSSAKTFSVSWSPVVRT